MHFTSILALSASLLASQAQAQLAPINPAAYMNGNIEVTPDPYANANPYPNPDPNPNANPVVNANPNPVHYPMAAYMTPSATPSMAPSMSMNMHMSMSMSMSTPHSMRPKSTHSAMRPASMGPMNSLIPMHPPSPKSSMMTKASSMKPMATPAPMVHGMNMPAQPIRHGGDGGIAPVEPMAPGSDVAPVLMGKPHGKDEGNAFCMGVCYPSKEEAKCGKPYASPQYKSDDCWRCCFTAPDF